MHCSQAVGATSDGLLSSSCSPLRAEWKAHRRSRKAQKKPFLVVTNKQPRFPWFLSDSTPPVRLTPRSRQHEPPLLSSSLPRSHRKPPLLLPLPLAFSASTATSSRAELLRSLVHSAFSRGEPPASSSLVPDPCRPPPRSLCVARCFTDLCFAGERRRVGDVLFVLSCFVSWTGQVGDAGFFFLAPGFISEMFVLSKSCSWPGWGMIWALRRRFCMLDFSLDLFVQDRFFRLVFFFFFDRFHSSEILVSRVSFGEWRWYKSCIFVSICSVCLNTGWTVEAELVVGQIIRVMCAVMIFWCSRTMGASAATGMQMVAARPCISASQGMLTSRAAVSRIGRALSTTTGFATCPRICYSSPLGSSKRSGVAIRAMSSESGPQGLPIDLRGNSLAAYL